MAGWLSAWACVACFGQQDYKPFVHGASAEGANAIKGFQIAPKHAVELFAAEPLLANPVVFTTDRKGRFYVVETFRLHAGVTDIRGHMDWLDGDLACRTIADRVALYRQKLGKDFPTYEAEHDRLKLVWSSKNAGPADKAEVFAEGFKNAADGIAAGVLARDDGVWFNCIPDLWKFSPDGKKRESLATGFGVHVGFLGHDLHGLVMGPDGRIYFSIGDRGLNVKNKEGKDLFWPDAGAVLRCEPDGSRLEIFARGLRNPQELAFDHDGNLFTGDNNSDSGDKARFLHLVEGGDYGWRIGYQFIEQPVQRGPWNAEKLWEPDVATRAWWLQPPLRNFADGPSGLCFDPGMTRLGPEFAGRFFLCDFRGSPNQSGIRTVKLKPKGSTFEWEDDGRIVWQTLVTDCEFAPDGTLAFSDWVDGWGKPGKGRLYKIAGNDPQRDAAAKSVEKILNEGFRELSEQRLAELLGFGDYRIRLEAQLELVRRNAFQPLILAALAWEPLARRHAAWGLGQLARGKPEPAVLKALRGLAVPTNANAGHAATALGDIKDQASRGKLEALLAAAPTVRRHAANALGKLGRERAVDANHPLAKLAAEPATLEDPALRNAVALGLAGLATPAELLALAQEPKTRPLATIALRKAAAPELAKLLIATEPLVALEAARAIHDLPIPAAIPALAAQADAPKHWDDAYLKRVLAANRVLGGKEHAERIAKLAAMERASAIVRGEALFELGEWAKPNGKDRVIGVWRPLPARSPEPAAAALSANLPAILKLAGPKEQQAAIKAVVALKIAAAPLLKTLFADTKHAAPERAAALLALGELKDPEAAALAKAAVASKEGELRSAGRGLLAKLDPAAAVPLLAETAAQGELRERQAALATLAGIARPEAEAALAEQVKLLLAGQAAPEIALDVLEAAGQRGAPALKALVGKHEAARKQGDALAAYRECLQGGDPYAGRQVFFNNAAVSCVRCHRLGSNGGEVGPDLSGLGAKQPREYLLEAIVAPDAKIAQGFETVVLALDDGTTVTGVLRAEDAKTLKLVTADGKVLIVAKESIEARKRGQSAMPADLVKKLSKRELRDLLEYLVKQPKWSEG